VSGGVGGSLLGEAWGLHRVWSQVAGRLKARIDRARDAGLVLGILGAVLGVVATQVGTDVVGGRLLAVVAGVAVGLVPLVRRGASQVVVRTWTRARSVSEGLKSEVYAYLSGGSAYEGEARDRVLAARTRDIVASVGDVIGAAAGVSPDGRPLPAVDGIDSYVRVRVGGQIDGYYRPRAAAYARRLGWFRRVEATLGAAGVVVAVLVGTGGVAAVGAWVAVVSTLAAAVAAHAGAARYDHQIVEFERTASRLAQLRACWQVEGWSPSALIDACEEAISIENQAWMARWTDSDGQPEAPAVDPS
jgi:hypothetical protein